MTEAEARERQIAEAVAEARKAFADLQIADKLIALARLTEWIALEEKSWLPELEAKQ
jgi:hypothetical protein